MTIDYLFNAIADEYQENRIPGWCPLEKAMDLAATVVALRPKVVLETGVFGGKSAAPLALAAEAVGGDCKVVCIDPWDSGASQEGYDGENAAWWAALNHQQIYESFVTTIKRLGIERRVEILRMKSEDAPVPEVLDIIHLDSQHTELAVREVKKFAPHVRVGGIAVFDDCTWRNGADAPVERAMQEIKKLGFVELYRRIQPNGNWAAFQRVSVPAPAIEAPKEIRITKSKHTAKRG